MHVAALTSLADGAGEVFTRLRDTPGFGRAAPDQAFLKELIRVIGHRNKGRELLAVLNFLDQISDLSVCVCVCDGIRRWAAARRRAAGALPGEAPADIRSRPDRGSQRQGARAASHPGDRPAGPHGVHRRDAQRALLAGRDRTAARPPVRRHRRARPAGRSRGREGVPRPLAQVHAAPEAGSDARAPRQTGSRAWRSSKPSRPAPCCATSSRRPRLPGCAPIAAPAVRSLAAAVFEAPAAADRRAVIERYRPALDLRGNAVRGATTFKAKCATCHQPGQDGYALGPGAEALKVFGKEEVLTHLLDPNRTVDARYRLYQIDTSDGASLTGIIQNESENSVTVRQPFGASADAAAVPDCAAAGARALDDAGWPRGRPVAAGHGGPAAVHRRHRTRSGALSARHYQGGSRTNEAAHDRSTSSSSAPVRAAARWRRTSRVRA